MYNDICGVIHINSYDFDKTIFDGDSTVKFYLYCLMRTPRMWLRLPRLAFEAAFVLKKDKQRFKQNMFAFLKDLKDPEAEVIRFWDRHINGIKPYYAAQKRDDDIIISASPEFLVREAMKRLGKMTVMASPVDIRTGMYTGLNCHGKEKVRRLYEAFPGIKIDKFYSDSHSDDPMAEIAEEAVLVRGNELLPWN